MRRALIAACLCAVAACGSSGSPTSPSPTPNSPGTSQPGSVSVVRLEDGAAVAGATVQTLTGASRTAVTDTSGRATFDPALAAGTEISVTAAGFITRQEISSRFGGSFTLAPNRPGGFDLPFLQELVYAGTSTTAGAKVTNRIILPVAIVLPAEWQNDAGVLASFQGAASDVTQANGRFPFTVETAPGSDKLRVEVRIKGDLSAAGQAVYSVNPASGVIVEAALEIRDRNAALNRNLVAHEMIHVLGLAHVSGRTSIMAPVVSTGIQPDDALAMKFLVGRNPLNRYEDDGRAATALSLAGQPPMRVTFVCR